MESMEDRRRPSVLVVDDSANSLKLISELPRLYRHIGMAAPGADFRRDRGATNDGYWLSPSEERRGDRQNRPRPFGLRGKLAHACRRGDSSSTLEPPKPSDSA